MPPARPNADILKETHVDGKPQTVHSYTTRHQEHSPTEPVHTYNKGQ